MLIGSWKSFIALVCEFEWNWKSIILSITSCEMCNKNIHNSSNVSLHYNIPRRVIPIFFRLISLSTWANKSSILNELLLLLGLTKLFDPSSVSLILFYRDPPAKLYINHWLTAHDFLSFSLPGWWTNFNKSDNLYLLLDMDKIIVIQVF